MALCFPGHALCKPDPSQCSQWCGFQWQSLAGGMRDGAGSFVWAQVTRQMEGRNTEPWSWGSSKRCEENTDGKTKRGGNIKGNDICVSCQTRRSRAVKSSETRKWTWNESSCVGVRAMALVPDFNYNNNQIDTEKWETSHCSLLLGLNEDLPGWASNCSNPLRKLQPVVTRGPACKAPHGPLQTFPLLFLRSAGETVLF